MVKVVELFAGVGGFRLGLEIASNSYKTIWANQWEPYKKGQSAKSNLYHFFPLCNVNKKAGTSEQHLKMRQ